MSMHGSQPLVQKLGYTRGHTVWVHNAPQSFWAELRTADIPSVPALPADWAHIFASREGAFHQILQKTNLEKISRGLWISWPKQSSGQLTDITEERLRDILLPLGWADSKACSIDDIWAGLQFVRRKT